MYYRHQLDYKYPEKSDEHMIDVKHLRDVDLNLDYPYLQKSFWYKCKRVFLWIMLNGLVFHLLHLTHGLRIYGRENLKKHKDALKNGAITISNHVFMWDFICVMKAIRPRLSFFPAWKTNLEGPNGGVIRLAGGIPIPTHNLRCMVKFKQALEEVLAGKKWLHFYPEGSLWFFYPDIRPLKKAVFKYAVEFDRPVLPITMSFRERKGITRLFTKKPCTDLHVGEPLYPDKTLSPTEAAQKLRAEAYHVMQVMNGINPGDPTYNENQDIETYVKTM
ncbi:MAG: 1-acyl-sn-glycerol-3-phosphate acyltransferase [Clostridia bacterium]|nr:1-acyl-sn-glycerol-3-phosphate acyltransferase [Clostridia bacterium]